jgi:uncharacterized protein (UPF0332 family)
VSPRSQEFMTSAHARIAAAHASLAAGFPAVTLSAAYYASLYAARAALSEEDRNAKTHRGVWSLFGEIFVATGRFDSGVYADARRAQELREAGDYDARDISDVEAREGIAAAERFVAAVDAMLAD